MNKKHLIIIFVSAGIFILLSFFLFSYKQKFDTNWPINSQRFSQFASFISLGISGLSIFLIYSTYQQTIRNYELSKENSFDTTFFNCLRVHDSIVQGLQKLPESEKQRTKEYEERFSQKYSEATNFFELIYRILHFRYKHEKHTLESYFKDYDWMIGHYLRSFISIIELVDKNSLSEERKRFYARIFQARLSNDEMRLVFYFLLSQSDKTEEERQRKKELANLFRRFSFFDVVKDALIYGNDVEENDWNKYLRLLS